MASHRLFFLSTTTPTDRLREGTQVASLLACTQSKTDTIASRALYSHSHPLPSHILNRCALALADSPQGTHTALRPHVAMRTAHTVVPSTGDAGAFAPQARARRMPCLRTTQNGTERCRLLLSKLPAASACVSRAVVTATATDDISTPGIPRSLDLVRAATTPALGRAVTVVVAPVAAASEER